jgi:protoheme IX farnesyltransferase
MSEPGRHAATADHAAASGGGASVGLRALVDFITLTKPRLNFLVILTTLAAYYLGMDDAASLARLVHTMIGTMLVAAGSSALNQVWEKDTDRLMRRTADRPLPAARVAPATASWFGALLSLAGLIQLWFFATPLAAVLAGATLATYLVWYTPLKLRSSLSTIVGAIPGALPALIGWAAATNSLSIGGWVLFGIVFLWQMPHFLAIAWMHRDDYAQAGMPLLPVIEPDGRSTGRQAVLYAAAMVPVSCLPTLIGLAGPRFLIAALALGAIVLWLALQFAAARTHATARRLFFATIIYLPLLWAALVVDHATRG